MKNSQYLLHDCCARNNAKMLSLTADKGLEGYGAYWVLLESSRAERLLHALVFVTIFSQAIGQIHSMGGRTGL